ncbi:MAG: FAD-dependent oxidoreductase [Candidatus Brocadiia bacterium]
MKKSSDLECDVLVIGAGSAGIPAAIGAARAGADVVLLEEDPVVGGAAVDQFVAKPGGGPRRGVVGEYMGTLREKYPLTDRQDGPRWSYWYLPADIIRVFDSLLQQESNLTVVRNARISNLLVEKSQANDRVAGAVVQCGDQEQIYHSPVVVDATGAGALGEQAGCEIMFGEESADDFGEEIAPEEPTEAVQQCTWMYVSQKREGAKPIESSQLQEGHLVSGYGFVGSKSDDFDEWDTGIYLHWGCRIRCPDVRDPQALADTQREALNLMSDDLDYLRDQGYAVYLGPRIGVREERRIRGEYVITYEHLREGKIPDDTVTVTGRGIDIWTEGKANMDYPEVNPYGIPYRSLVPRGVDGLLVAGKHLSGTHIAMSAYRVQCILGNVGQAAGVAAALCAEQNCQPRELNSQKLLSKLQAPPQGLTIQSDG